MFCALPDGGSIPPTSKSHLVPPAPDGFFCKGGIEGLSVSEYLEDDSAGMPNQRNQRPGVNKQDVCEWRAIPPTSKSHLVPTAPDGFFCKGGIEGLSVSEYLEDDSARTPNQRNQRPGVNKQDVCEWRAIPPTCPAIPFHI